MSHMSLGPALEPEPKIAAIVHQLLRDRSVDRPFAFDDNLRDVGLTSLDMTNLVLAVEAELAIGIPDRAITPANFTFVATIGRLVTELLQAGATPPRAAAGR
jgi:acyl carrier protein